MAQLTGSKLGKEYVKAVYCHPAYLTYIQSIHHVKCWTGWITSGNQGCWEKYQWPQIHKWYHPYGRKQRRTKEPLDESERGVWKSWLKTTFRKQKSWHLVPSLHGELMGKQCQTIFLGSKITADGDCSHEIKRCLLLGRKAMTNLDSILKSRDITLPTNVHLVKLRFFQ